MILPFIWIFNPQLLLIDVDGVGRARQRRRRVDARDARLRRGDDGLVPDRKSRWWEIAAAAGSRACCCSGPTSSWISSRPSTAPAGREGLRGRAAPCPTDERLVMVIKGTTIEGEDITQDGRACNSAPPATDGRKRLADAGLTLVRARRRVQHRAVKFGSAREEVAASSRAGRSRGQGADRPAVAALVLSARARADRVRLVVAGTADARDGAPRRG